MTRRPLPAALAALALAACASAPPVHFHSLLPPPAAAAPAVALPATPAWELLPVAVPPQVDQAGWVVRQADGSVALLENERWIGPLGDEIRAAVAERLRAAALPGQRGPWRVALDVSRFETAPGRQARIDAEWTVSNGAPVPAKQRCRGAFEQPAAASYAAVAAAHRAAVARLGDAIAATLRALDGGAAACG